MSSAAKVLKRAVTDSNDEFMTAMIAFDEAINRYDQSKGKFLSFASMIIRNRLIDELRRNLRNTETPFSEFENERGVSFDIPYDDNKWEIEALTAELAEFGISFFELASVSPKSRKTKRQYSFVRRTAAGKGKTRKPFCSERPSADFSTIRIFRILHAVSRQGV